MIDFLHLIILKANQNKYGELEQFTFISKGKDDVTDQNMAKSGRCRLFVRYCDGGGEIGASGWRLCRCL